MGAKSGRKATKAQTAASQAAGFKRFALVVFLVLFLALFVIFWAVQGIGQPSVPSGDVAVVKGVPDGSVSEAQYRRGLAQQVAQGQLKKTPARGSKKYEELQTTAMTELLQSIWIRGEAEEMGVEITDKQVESELAQIKKANFPTEKLYRGFLKSSGYTQADVDEKVELQVLSTEIQQEVLKQAPPVSKAAIADYYEANKEAQFTTKPSRDVRIVVNRSKAKAEAAKEALDEDDSDANWKVVAKKYSVDPTTKTKGGLQKEISEEFLQGALKKAIFGSATGEVLGPIAFQKNYFVVEVEKLNPEKVKALAEVSSQISTQLTQEQQQEFFSEWISSFQAKWVSRTYCAADFLFTNCANYKSNGRPSGAPEACYEANPKTPATECPAPVEAIKPALPGSVTVLKPKGEPLVQRPLPEATKSAKEAIEEKAKGGAETGE